MYVLTENKNVVKFPYSIEQLKKDNPNVSFPAKPNNETLDGFKVFPVFSPELIYNPATQVSTQDGCAYNEESQRWEIVWSVRDKTAEELAAEYEQAANSVRKQRTRLLAGCDWTQLDDTPISNESKLHWAVYRQQLRAVPEQDGFPFNVVWPTQP